MAPDPERHKGELLKIPVLFPNEKEIFEGDPIPESFEYKEMMIRSIEFYPGRWVWRVVHRDED